MERWRREASYAGDPRREGSYTDLTKDALRLQASPSKAARDLSTLATGKAALKDALVTQIPALTEYFQKADCNLSGWLGRDAIYEALVVIGRDHLGLLEISPHLIEATIDEFDPSATSAGEINYEEWLRLALRDAVCRASVRLLNLIRARDTAKTGGVDKAAFRHAICAFGYEASREFLDRIFDEMDLERTGWLRFDDLHQQLRLGSAVRLANKGYSGMVVELSARSGPAPLRGSLFEQFLGSNGCIALPREGRLHSATLADNTGQPGGKNRADSGIAGRPRHENGLAVKHRQYPAPRVARTCVTRAEANERLSRPPTHGGGRPIELYAGTNAAGEPYYFDEVRPAGADVELPAWAGHPTTLDESCCEESAEAAEAAEAAEVVEGSPPPMTFRKSVHGPLTTGSVPAVTTLAQLDAMRRSRASLLGAPKAAPPRPLARQNMGWGGSLEGAAYPKAKPPLTASATVGGGRASREAKPALAGGPFSSCVAGLASRSWTAQPQPEVPAELLDGLEGEPSAASSAPLDRTLGGANATASSLMMSASLPHLARSLPTLPSGERTTASSLGRMGTPLGTGLYGGLTRRLSAGGFSTGGLSADTRRSLASAESAPVLGTADCDPSFFGSATGVAVVTASATLQPTGAVMRKLGGSRSAGQLLMRHPSDTMQRTTHG